MSASVSPPCTALSADAPLFDAQLLRKMSRPGPRYTSYPTADRFSGQFGYHDYLAAVASRRTRGFPKPVSLYLHIPFCDTVCYYCACNKIVTRRLDKAAVYLSYLKREIAMQAALFSGMNQLRQLHLGGGTPTYLNDAQMDELMAHLRHHFEFADDADGEFAIEVDPRTVTPERIVRLRQQGFNRISLGVQDYDEAVQRAVNRVQPQSQTQAIIDAARACGYRSINIDLIYGLPEQNLATMAQTLDKVVQANPDRIALYHYAHLPHLFKPQRRIDTARLPDAQTKLDMLGLAIERLGQAGYVYIGMDHFARPDDELAVAQRQGRLHRNFQGYSTHPDADLIACGVSAIGAVGATYSQNVKTLEAYYERIDNNELPIERGVALGMDDLLRRSIIQMLMCQFELSTEAVEQAFPIDFADYFAAEMPQLRALEDDGLVELKAGWISVTARGRLLIRNVCMVFDAYLATPVPSAIPRFSRTL
ncbi:oxygen-independent coproporphyrinogen III oxidase [Massilia sp. DWR3-1-1]|uniref:oxygen-independent coproporphyrinogen III oxidase n=1 Tax=Massilia sp. DWR3-1-1 TaxID=2804559 RepID=UPI003CF222BC